MVEHSETSIVVAKAGANPSVRRLSRANVAWLYEAFQKPDFRLCYQPTLGQGADVVTKAFKTVMERQRAGNLTGAPPSAVHGRKPRRRGRRAQPCQKAEIGPRCAGYDKWGSQDKYEVSHFVASGPTHRQRLRQASYPRCCCCAAGRASAHSCPFPRARASPRRCSNFLLDGHGVLWPPSRSSSRSRLRDNSSRSSYAPAAGAPRGGWAADTLPGQTSRQGTARVVLS